MKTFPSKPLKEPTLVVFPEVKYRIEELLHKNIELFTIYVFLSTVISIFRFPQGTRGRNPIGGILFVVDPVSILK